jgi:hypothetical protein
MQLHLKRPGVVALCAALMACGGGGGSTPTTIAGNGEGAYFGPVSNGATHYTLVLEDGTYYAMYGNQVSGVLSVTGLIQGTGTGSNGSFTSTNLRDYPFSGAPISGSLSASYTATPTFNGTITEPTATFTFTGAAPATSGYVYNQAPVFSNIVGTWAMTTHTGNALTINIAANNTFTGTAGGCSFSGTIAPRPTGKNVYNVNVTFGAAPCALPNQSESGIAVDSLLANGMRQLLVAVTDASRANGSVLFGAK